MIVLLLSAAFWGLRQIHSIQREIENLEGSEAETSRLIVALEDEQAALNAVFYRLSGDPQNLDREEVQEQLDRSNRQIAQMASGFAGTTDAPLWTELKVASGEFAMEAKRLLALESEDTLLSRDLFRNHNLIIGTVARLSQGNHRKALETQQQLAFLTQSFARSTSILLGSCLLLALICSVFTVRVTGRLFRRTQWQAGELSRVSWHLLEKQEETARRFSHELHDEMGQSLTALKANVANLTAETAPGPVRLDAINQLLDQAIGDVRQMSQLLRPTILDDFGLDASLRWLIENFSKHTGLEVRYQSGFKDRLPETLETHLFRIAQEALTNVAKHSAATHVEVSLQAAGGFLRLSIQDNGKGLPAASDPGRQNGLGLVGMRTRARAMEGELNLSAPPGGGLRVEIRVPLSEGVLA